MIDLATLHALGFSYVDLVNRQGHNYALVRLLFDVMILNFSFIHVLNCDSFSYHCELSCITVIMNIVVHIVGLLILSLTFLLEADVASGS